MNILVWLPSPMGDAILCTPALRAIRRRFADSQICFHANSVVRQVLSPSRFNDTWLEQSHRGPLAAARAIKAHRFSDAFLLKNSFGSALSVFLAGIPSRIGYARQARGFLLTEKLRAPREPDGRYRPHSMVDYYLAIACKLGAETTGRELELGLDAKDRQSLSARLPQINRPNGPIVALVPGGAYGPSKCWMPERFAQTADRIIAGHNATVVICVSDEPAEKRIAADICRSSSNKLVNLGENPITPGQLKALLAGADLVITNDTGPRHIATAFKRKVITLFGPNDPAWTDTGYENEIKIVGAAPCAPCTKPVCRKGRHLCMEAITVDMVCLAADTLLTNSQT